MEGKNTAFSLFVLLEEGLVCTLALQEFPAEGLPGLPSLG